MAVLQLALLFALTALNAYKLVLLVLLARRRNICAPNLPREWPHVVVQIPLYNERSVARRAIDAVCRFDYPIERLTVQVLDDSTDDTVQIVDAAIREWAGRGPTIEHRRRRSRDGFKAGALRDGLRATQAELVAVFDADFVPGPDFLKRTVGYFSDPRIGVVQTRWTFLNSESSLLTSVQALFLDGHFLVQHAARSRWGLFFHFNGTAGIWRRAAIESAGGWSAATLTEDLDLSYRARLAGWHFAYAEDVGVPSELPPTLAALKSQQFRWAKGMTQVALRLLPSLWRARLAWSVRLDATVHLLSGLSYPLTLTTTILAIPWLLAGAPRTPGAGALLPLVAFNSCINLAFYGAGAWRAGVRGWKPFARLLGMLPVGMGLSLNGTLAVLAGLIGWPSTFVRTPKQGLVGRARWLPRHAYASRGGPPWELALATAYAATALAIVPNATPVALAFLALFGLGYFYVSGLHAVEWVRRVRAR